MDEGEESGADAATSGDGESQCVDDGAANSASRLCFINKDEKVDDEAGTKRCFNTW